MQVFNVRVSVHR